MSGTGTGDGIGTGTGGHPGAEELQGTVRQVRAGMADAADGIRSPQLLARVHRQAGRRRRARAAAALSVAGVAVAATGLATLTRWHGPGAVVTSAQPAAARTTASGPPGPATAASGTAPGTVTSGTATSGPSAPGTATSGPSAPGTATSPTGTHRPATPAGPGTAGSWQEEFDAAPRIGTRWIPYTEGGTNPWTTFSTDAVTARDGSLRLALRYDRSGSARAGGTRAVTGTAATGRWEVRWRAGTGNGALGVLVLGSDDGRNPLSAVLDPVAGTLTVSDVAGDARTVPVDARSYRRVAVTVTGTAVTWQLDGTTIATWPAPTSLVPLWPALQVDSRPACRGTSAAATCPGTGEASELQVDRVDYTPV